MFEFIEGLYSYWRSLERYALIQSNGNDQGIQNVNFKNVLQTTEATLKGHMDQENGGW